MPRATSAPSWSRALSAARPDDLLRIADVAVFYGERSGGIRTYLDAKAAFAAASGAFEHHLIVPGPRERHAASRHELPGVPVGRANGYRLPLGARALARNLRRVRPDVVVLHDPWWSPARTATAARELGAIAVIVHHCSIGHASAAVRVPSALARPALRAWTRRAYRRVGIVMGASDPSPDVGVPATLPLRLGLQPVFRPRPQVERGDHVLYVGRLGREKGIVELVDAAARSVEPWPLRIVGAGSLRAALERRCRHLGIAHRTRFDPYIHDREALAQAYSQAACVVVPGAFDTFGLVALEAAACGARVVACETSPAGRRAGALAHLFAPADTGGLLRAIEQARRAPRDFVAAARLAAQHTWEAAFTAELADLQALLRATARERAFSDRPLSGVPNLV